MMSAGAHLSLQGGNSPGWRLCCLVHVQLNREQETNFSDCPVQSDVGNVRHRTDATRAHDQSGCERRSKSLPRCDRHFACICPNFDPAQRRQLNWVACAPPLQMVKKDEVAKTTVVQFGSAAAVAAAFGSVNQPTNKQTWCGSKRGRTFRSEFG